MPSGQFSRFARYACLLLAAVLAAAAPAPDTRCTLDAAGLRPRLAEKAPELKGKVRRKREKQALTEEAALADEARLKAVQGGCAHFGKTYEFAQVRDKENPTERKHYLEAAARLLELKIGPQGQPLDAELAGRLREAALSLDKWLKESTPERSYVWGECSIAMCATEFACGIATCGVEVVRGGGGRVSITAVYEFPM